MAAKYKKMTNKEKQERKEIRQELREKGLLPPIKPKLNRLKFAKEVMAEYKNAKKVDLFGYILEGLTYMLPSIEYQKNISSEEIGVLKVLKLALEVKKFEENHKAQGKTTFGAMELVDNVILPIKEL